MFCYNCGCHLSEHDFLVAYCQVLKVYYEENIICLLGKYLP